MKCEKINGNLPVDKVGMKGLKMVSEQKIFNKIVGLDGVRVTLGAFIFILTLISSLKGEESAPKDTITLQELIQEALKENPQIKSARAKWEASQAVPKQVSTLPDPMLMLGLRNVGSKYSLGTEEMSMLEFGITQRLPFPGKLSLLGKIAQSSSNALEEEYRLTVLEVIEKLKSSFFDYYYVEKAIETVQRTIELFNQIERTAEIRYQVGKGSQQDVWKAQLEISRLKERLAILIEMEGSLTSTINSILNRSPDSFIGKPESSDLTEFNYELQELIELVQDNSPELKKIDRLRERDKFGLSYAKLQYLPDFSLLLGYGDRAGMVPLWTAQIGIEIPLYFWRKQAYGVREARLNLASTEESYLNTKRVLESEIKSIFLEITTADKLIALYRDAIIPQARGALESSRAGYSVGSVDFLTLITNAITLLDYQIEYLKKITEREKAIAKLEVLTGVQFTSQGLKKEGNQNLKEEKNR